MSNVVIAGTATGATPLPVANSVDGSQDYIPIYTNSATATQAINRATYLGITGSPVGTSDTQALTNKTLGTTNSVTQLDGTFTLKNTSDPTKLGLFSLSGVTTGTTRTYTLPNASVTLSSLSGTETLTNKTLTSPTINSPTITNATISSDSYTGYSASTTGSIYGISVSSGAISSALTVSALLTASAGFTLSSGTLTLPNNSITAPMLATSAVYLGSVQVTSSQSTSSNTAVQVTGATVTVTIPAGGRKTKVTATWRDTYNATASNNNVSLWRGTVGSGNQLAASLNNSQGTISGSLVAIDNPSAGSVTYNLGFLCSAGTLNIEAASGQPITILVEAC